MSEHGDDAVEVADGRLVQSAFPVRKLVPVAADQLGQLTLRESGGETGEANVPADDMRPPETGGGHNRIVTLAV